MAEDDLCGTPEQLAAEWVTGKIVMPSPTLGEGGQHYGAAGRQGHGSGPMSAVWWWRLGIAIVLVILIWITHNHPHVAGCC